MPSLVDLPTDCLHSIFKFCSVKDKAKVLRSNRQLASAFSNYPWNSDAYEGFVTHDPLPAKPAPSDWKSLVAARRDLGSGLPDLSASMFDGQNTSKPSKSSRDSQRSINEDKLEKKSIYKPMDRGRLGHLRKHAVVHLPSDVDEDCFIAELCIPQSNGWQFSVASVTQRENRYEIKEHDLRVIGEEGFPSKEDLKNALKSAR
jgi:hypothetical protein